MCSSDYEYVSDGDLLYSAWQLAEKVEVNRDWAFVLSDLYSAMSYVPYAIEQDTIDRWRNDCNEDEVDSNGFLSRPFTELRSYLYHSHVKYKHDNIDLQNPDVAYRNATYRFAHLKAEQIYQGYIKDGNMAARGILWNNNVWRCPESREALSEICEKSNNETISFAIVNDVFKKEHPEWFKEYEEIDPDNEPLTVRKLKDLLETFKKETVRETRDEVSELLSDLESG